MSAVARAIVKASARTLPVSMRDRYREQWLADVRDAGEAGVSSRQIAAGALSFAATVARPLPSFANRGRADAGRRSALAIALALSAALMALCAYVTSAGSSSGLTGSAVYDLVVELATGLLGLYLLCAPIAAVLLVLLTRGVIWRARVAVGLFSIACIAPTVSSTVNSGFTSIDNVFVSPGAIAYLIGIAFVATGCALVWRISRGRSFRGAIEGGAAVALAVAVGLGIAVSAWNLRPFARYQMPPSEPMYAEWLRNSQWFGQVVGTLFVWWAVIGGALAVLAVIFGVIFSGRHARALVIATVAVISIATAGIWSFLEAVGGGTYPPALVDVVRIGGQFVLIAVILVVVGGLRYERRALPRVGHRHDVEGSVELL
jgi:MFS family permease